MINNKKLKLIIYLEFYKKTDFLNLEYILNEINCDKKRKILLNNSSKRNILENVFSIEHLLNTSVINQKVETNF